MKKVLILLFLIILTGCTHKETLVCSKTTDLGEQIVTFKYIDDKFNEGKIKYIITVTEDELAQAKSDIKKTFEENFSSANLTITDNNKDQIVVLLSFDEKNVNQEIGNYTYQELKNNLTKESFTCN